MILISYRMHTENEFCRNKNYKNRAGDSYYYE